MDQDYNPDLGEMPKLGQNIKITLLPRDVRFRVQRFIGKGPTFTLDMIPDDKRSPVLEFFEQRNEEISSKRTSRAPHGEETHIGHIPKPLLPG